MNHTIKKIHLYLVVVLVILTLPIASLTSTVISIKEISPVGNKQNYVKEQSQSRKAKLSYLPYKDFSPIIGAVPPPPPPPPPLLIGLFHAFFHSTFINSIKTAVTRVAAFITRRTISKVAKKVIRGLIKKASRRVTKKELQRIVKKRIKKLPLTVLEKVIMHEVLKVLFEHREEVAIEITETVSDHFVEKIIREINEHIPFFTVDEEEREDVKRLFRKMFVAAVEGAFDLYALKKRATEKIKSKFRKIKSEFSEDGDGDNEIFTAIKKAKEKTKKVFTKLTAPAKEKISKKLEPYITKVMTKAIETELGKKITLILEKHSVKTVEKHVEAELKK